MLENCRVCRQCRLVLYCSYEDKVRTNSSFGNFFHTINRLISLIILLFSQDFLSDISGLSMSLLPHYSCNFDFDQSGATTDLVTNIQDLIP
jgi:hypothetical protein